MALIGALMAGSTGLVFAGIFGAIGFGALSIVLDSSAQSSAKLFGAIFGACFALVGVVAGVAVITSAVRSLRGSATKPATAQAPTAVSAFGTPQVSTAFGTTSSKDADPIISAYNASRTAAPSVPQPSPLNLVPGLQAAVKASATRDPVDELAKLADLHQKGALTDEEFANAKAKLLGHM